MHDVWRININMLIQQQCTIQDNIFTNDKQYAFMSKK